MNQAIQLQNPPEYSLLQDKVTLLKKIDNCQTMNDFQKLFREHCINTSNPYFLNQLYGNVDQTALQVEHLISNYNTNVYTYEVAPVFTLIEKETVKYLLKKIGFDVEKSDGIFTQGGSISNLYGMLLARHQHNRKIKQDGISQKLYCLISEASHYSIKKNANILGIGEDNVIEFKAHQNNYDLERLLKEFKPFVVCLVAGSTVLGDFDNLDTIITLCHQYHTWVHVDASFGGCALFSSEHKNLLGGIEMADSVSWNFHKVLSLPIPCSVFLTRHKDVLRSTTYKEARYLFRETDEIEPLDLDIGQKTLFCGRKADATKLYVLLKVHGESYLENKIDSLFKLRDRLVREIEIRKRFYLICQPTYLNVCFVYTDDISDIEKTSQTVLSIRQRLLEENIMIGVHQIGAGPHFFRVPVINQFDVDFLLDAIDRFGFNISNNVSAHTFS